MPLPVLLRAGLPGAGRDALAGAAAVEVLGVACAATTTPYACFPTIGSSRYRGGEGLGINFDFERMGAEREGRRTMRRASSLGRDDMHILRPPSFLRWYAGALVRYLHHHHPYASHARTYPPPPMSFVLDLASFISLRLVQAEARSAGALAGCTNTRKCTHASVPKRQLIFFCLFLERLVLKKSLLIVVVQLNLNGDENPLRNINDIVPQHHGSPRTDSGPLSRPTARSTGSRGAAVLGNSAQALREFRCQRLAPRGPGGLGSVPPPVCFPNAICEDAPHFLLYHHHLFPPPVRASPRLHPLNAYIYVFTVNE
ncbi:hypothetical protein B0H13DRAFT_2349621 [Mycena leptocephala]|nr:hypothetical protein B0H13DRAFT_2349621 [Mycena leptocephala]